MGSAGMSVGFLFFSVRLMEVGSPTAFVSHDYP